MSQKYDELEAKFNSLEEALQRRKEKQAERKQKKKQAYEQLCDSLQEKTQRTISRLEELKRKETILITMKNIVPEIPENFPKNYFVQLTYEDVVVTGNHKFTDFDENIIEQKFIVPLLSSPKIRVQIYAVGEQESTTVYDEAEINLERIVEECLLNQDKCEDEVNLSKGDGKEGSDQKISLSFNVQLQGIGFSSWLKNISLQREVATQKQILKTEERKRRSMIDKKVQSKKKSFNEKFLVGKNIEESKQYELGGVDTILMMLDD